MCVYIYYVYMYLSFSLARAFLSLSLSLSFNPPLTPLPFFYVVIAQVIGELSKALDDVVKKHERLIQKKRQITKDLNSTRREIQAFQNAKQQQLNKFTAYICLETNQLKNLGSPSPRGDGEDASDDADPVAAVATTLDVDPASLQLCASGIFFYFSPKIFCVLSS